MFTGLIQDLGTVASIRHNSTYMKLAIRSALTKQIHLGESIAVNGVCLTVQCVQNDIFYVDVVPQTMRMTSLGLLHISDKVNLEQAMQAESRLDGHWVSGHIDGTGRIRSLRKDGNAVLMKINAKPELLKFMILQGSIAVEGVSLTICALSSKDFSISIIPHTALVTTLLSKHSGQIVNLETDILAKYTHKSLALSSNISHEFLRQNGF